MSSESSHQVQQPEQMEFPEPFLPKSEEEKIAYVKSFLIPEPIGNLSNFNFSGLDAVLEAIHTCEGFRRIISYRPQLWLPEQIARFFITYQCPVADDVFSATFRLACPENVEDPIQILPLICKTYGIPDSGDVEIGVWKGGIVALEIDEQVLNNFYNRAVMHPTAAYDGRKFARPLLHPEYRYLFDLIHKVLLAYTGNNDAVTPAKFRLMAAVMLNLPVNWARLLLALLNEEFVKIKESMDDNEVVTRFQVTKKLRYCSKVCAIINGISADTGRSMEWRGSSAFPVALLPKDRR